MEILALEAYFEVFLNLPLCGFLTVPMLREDDIEIYPLQERKEVKDLWDNSAEFSIKFECN